MPPSSKTIPPEGRVNLPEVKRLGSPLGITAHKSSTTLPPEGKVKIPLEDKEQVTHSIMTLNNQQLRSLKAPQHTSGGITDGRKWIIIVSHAAGRAIRLGYLYWQLLHPATMATTN